MSIAETNFYYQKMERRNRGASSKMLPLERYENSVDSSSEDEGEQNLSIFSLVLWPWFLPLFFEMLGQIQSLFSFKVL